MAFVGGGSEGRVQRCVVYARAKAWVSGHMGHWLIKRVNYNEIGKMPPAVAECNLQLTN